MGSKGGDRSRNHRAAFVSVRFQIGVLRLRPIDARDSPRCSFLLPDPGDCLKRFSNQ